MTAHTCRYLYHKNSQAISEVCNIIYQASENLKKTSQSLRHQSCSSLFCQLNYTKLDILRVSEFDAN